MTDTVLEVNKVKLTEEELKLVNQALIFGGGATFAGFTKSQKQILFSIRLKLKKCEKEE